MNIAGIILAGGLGTRMGYSKKAFIEINGRTIIDRLLSVYRPIFREIIIAAREKDDFRDMGFTVALDRFDARSSLTGIHAGLTKMTTSHGFFSACDAPFLQAGLVESLLSKVTPDADVIIPLKEDGYREPLCAVYSKRCLKFIEAQLKRDDYKIIQFFEHVNVKEVPVSQLKQDDPDLISFFNVNRPEELANAEELAREREL
jgi:molybdopterin-guanine dinucleotide biosynthesis protein A